MRNQKAYKYRFPDGTVSTMFYLDNDVFSGWEKITTEFILVDMMQDFLSGNGQYDETISD